MPGITDKPRAADDGLFHCTRPGCEDVSYGLPQHLGLHMHHKHGVPGKSRQGKPAQPVSKALAVVRRPKQPDLTADNLCMTVLAELAPSGSIPIHALPTYTRWLAATGEMMEALDV